MTHSMKNNHCEREVDFYSRVDWSSDGKTLLVNQKFKNRFIQSEKV